MLFHEHAELSTPSERKLWPGTARFVVNFFTPTSSASGAGQAAPTAASAGAPQRTAHPESGHRIHTRMYCQNAAGIFHPPHERARKPGETSNEYPG